MCLAIPGKVLEICGPKARVDFMGVETIVNIQLLSDIKVGDYVIVHAGCAIEKLSEADAMETLGIFEEVLGNADE